MINPSPGVVGYLGLNCGNTTPYRALYGRDPPKLLRYGDIPVSNAAVEEQIKDIDGMIAELRVNLERAQRQMQNSANKHRRDVEFQEGDMVYLKLKSYRQSSMAQRRNEKLAPRYFGPYKIIARFGKTAYKLELPSHSAIHPVFHVSQLKKALAPQAQVQEIPAILTSDLEWAIEPYGIVDIRKSSVS